MLVLLQQVSLATLEPKYGINSVIKLPPKPAIKTTNSCANKPLYNLILLFFFNFEHSILKHTQFPHWIWGIHIGLYIGF